MSLLLRPSVAVVIAVVPERVLALLRALRAGRMFFGLAFIVLVIVILLHFDLEFKIMNMEFVTATTSNEEPDLNFVSSLEILLELLFSQFNRTLFFGCSTKRIDVSLIDFITAALKSKQALALGTTPALVIPLDVTFKFQFVAPQCRSTNFPWAIPIV